MNVAPSHRVASVSASAEWRSMWPLPVVAMIGIAGQTSFAFSSGVFLTQMTEAFGWSRSDFTSGFTLHMLVYLIAGPIAGRIVDRIGPRKMVLIGILPFAAAYSALGLANGSVLQWWMLCIFLALGISCVSSAVWVTAVVGRFHAGRGGALAIALSGMGVSNTLAPLAAAYFIDTVGWRAAFPAIAGSWAVLVLPLAYLFFFGARDVPPTGTTPAATTRHSSASSAEYRQILRSAPFIQLALAGGLFAMMALGVTVHLVSILTVRGFELSTAASIAGAAGLANLLSQLGAGFLLDKISPRLLGLVAFLLPIATALLLLFGGTSLPITLAAVVIFGLAMGGQTDVVTYLASRLFPSHIFSSTYAMTMAIFAVSASFGPLIGAQIFDFTGSYDAYLAAMIPVALLAAIAFLGATRRLSK